MPGGSVHATGDSGHAAGAIFTDLLRHPQGQSRSGGGDPAPFGTEPVKSMAASSPEGGAVGPAEAESPDPRYV